MKGLLERLDDGVVLGAEGYLFELERRGYLKSGPYVPEVVLDFPDAVRELHREFLRAGAEVMVAFTYYGHREKMRTIGREDDLEPLNRNALRIAREVADEGDALVAGNICNTWVYDPAAPDESGAVVREMYREQVAWAVEEGADLVIAETNDYLGEALIATEVIKEAGLPAVVTFASSTPRRRSTDVAFDEACRQIADAGADVVGLNCSRGPATMLPILERVRDAVDVHVAAQPVPYRTTPERADLRHAPRTRTARAASRSGSIRSRARASRWPTSPSTARDLGVGYIGICCGGAPHHVRSMAEALGRDVPASRYSPDISLHPVLGDERDGEREEVRQLARLRHA